MRIDGFAHMLPRAFADAVLARVGSRPDVANWRERAGLYDVAARLRLLDEFEVDRQVLATTQPALEDLFDAPLAAELARLANDGMAELVSRHPDRFLGLATLSLLDPEQAVRELERCVRELHLVGAQIYSNVAGRALDRPELEVFWQAAEELDVPLWLHPARGQARADYLDETASRYQMFLVFGWPYDTTLAMARLVLSGVLARHPRLKIVAHHAGAMVPFFAGRVEKLYASVRLPDGASVMEGFRRFYVDTCTWGSVSALMCAYHTFGAERLIMGSDVPYGAEDGRDFLRETVRSLEYMPIPPKERERIAAGNLLGLLHRDTSNP